MDEKDLYWLAGLLEGEGSFLAGPPSSPTMSVIHVDMTDEDVIRRVAKLLGVSYVQIRNRSRNGVVWKPSYVTRVKGSRAVELMHQLRPLMGQRRQEQIDRALASYSKVDHLTTAAKLSREQVLEIYRRAHAGERHGLIAQDFAISVATVSNIRTGKSWSWLTKPEGEEIS